MKKAFFFAGIVLLLIVFLILRPWQIIERKAWRVANEKNNLESYLNYKSSFPDGEYIIIAGDSIYSKKAKLQFEVVQQTHSIDQYKEFIKKYPESQFSREIIDSINSIQRADSILKRKEYYNTPIGKVENLILGKRIFGVQFILDGYGTANITKENGLLKIYGSQFSKNQSEYLKINGTISIVNEKKFSFNGNIQLYTKSCCGVIDKTGIFTFVKSGNRKYWRLQEINKLCSIYTCAYYLDIFE